VCSSDLAVALVLSGIRPQTSIFITLTLFAFAFPAFAFLQRPSSLRISVTQSIFLSLTLITLLGSLLFAFTPVSNLPTGTWFALAATSWVAGWAILHHLSDTPLKTSGQDFLTFITVSSVSLAAVLLNSLTLRFDAFRPQWLPDDFPFFALLGQDVSQGNPGAAFFDGMQINYHWLTYSLFGGIGNASGTDQIETLTKFVPVLGWLLLGLGAASVVQVLTTRRAPIILGTLSVVFANSVGLYSYSTYGVGRSVASPSTLLTSAWLVGIILATYLLLQKIKPNPAWFLLFLIAGFGSALGKISTAVAGVVGMVIIVILESLRRSDKEHKPIKLLTRYGLTLVLPFILGILITNQTYLSETSTELGFEQSLNLSEVTDPYLGLITLLPVLVSVFSIAVMVFPVLASWNLIKSNSLVGSSAFLSVFGLLIVFLFDFGAGNEAWVITSSLALILPVSSVIVIDWLYSLKPRNRQMFVLTVILTLLISFTFSILLTANLTNATLELRPWLIPSLLVFVSLLVSVIWMLNTSSQVGISTTKFLLATSISFLFVTSITLGLVLRIEAAVNEQKGRDSFAQMRDNWITATSDFANLNQPEFQDSPVAIYSNSPGETTLVRWIPYFLSTPVYTLGTADQIPDYFTPQGEAERRRDLVAAYVESSDPIACNQLRSEGISTIWITQGIDLQSTGAPTTGSPRLLPIKCQFN
jgi:hypothetical protein